MTCPLSADRLRELVWLESPRWEPAQIATLAPALLGEPVDVATVRRWLAEAGVPLPSAAPPKAPPARPGVKRARRERDPLAGTALLVCAHCGGQFRRSLDRIVSERVFCGRPCHAAWQAEQARITAACRRSQAGRDLSVEKRCPACGEAKPLSAYSRDVSRRDGRTRTCKACNDAKSRAYYIRNQERLQARARARKKRGPEGEIDA